MASMRKEVRDAVESARTVSREDDPLFHLAKPQRRHSFGYVRALVLAVVRELPEDISIQELRDELEISENQVGEH